jgi:hypothetical protein
MFNDDDEDPAPLVPFDERAWLGVFVLVATLCGGAILLLAAYEVIKWYY